MNIEEIFSGLELKWLKDAKKMHRTIVLPEAEFSKRVYDAGLICAENNLCKVVFLTTKELRVRHQNIEVVNILNHDLTPVVASAYHVKRQHKGMTLKQAQEDVKDVYIFGAMMVDLGLVDGMVAGAEAPTKTVLSSAFKTVKAKKDQKASSFFVMIPPTDDQKTYLLSDGGAIIDPTATELADITEQSVTSYRQLVGKNPKVALLSYSTYGSAEGGSAEKTIKAVNTLKQRNVNFVYDGELQLDAAIVPEVAKKKCPKSPVKGNADILIFPDLQSGNIGYKLIQRFGNYKAVGPLLQGLNKPINDLSRGANVEEIVLSVAITILQG